MRWSFPIWVPACCISLVAVAGLAACGAGSGDPAPDSPGAENTSSGRVFPAAANVQFVEYDTQGRELQRSSPSDSAGMFRFARPLSGVRTEASTEIDPHRLSPIRSARYGGAITTLEITPATTAYDQLVEAGHAPGAARELLEQVVGAACGPAAGSDVGLSLQANLPLHEDRRAWLLPALAAYMEALREIGIGPNGLKDLWVQKISEHAPLLKRMCATAESMQSQPWRTKALARASNALARPLTAQELTVLGESSEHARTEILRLVGSTLPGREFAVLHGQDLALERAWQGREEDIALDVTEAQFKATLASTAHKLDSPATNKPSFGIIGSGLMQYVTGYVKTDGGSPPRLSITNQGSSERRFQLTVNNTSMTDFAGILAEVVATPPVRANEPLHERAWRYVSARQRHTWPISLGLFQHQPDLYLRSVGSGLCDDVSSALSWIWRGLGYEARVVGIGGHVVAEVKVDGRWQMYDIDYLVYYFNRSGQVASVDDLARDPQLVLRPITPILPVPNSAYSELIAKLYATRSDNLELPWFATPNVEPLGNLFTLPAGARLTLSAAPYLMSTIEPGQTVDLAPLRVWYPPGFSGTVELPMVLADVAGEGQVSLLGSSTPIPAAGMADTIAAYYRSGADLAIKQVRLDNVGPAGVTVTMLVNPLVFRPSNLIKVRAYGANVSGLVVGNAIH